MAPWRLICVAVLFVTAEAELTLEMVQEVVRHGDRSPVDIYPNDPHQASAWPKGLSALTTLGIKQQYDGGKFLRERYNDFLNATYLPWEIHVNSSALDRCLMSAQTRLAGLYQPVGSDVWNPDLKWQPIPVHSVPLWLDFQLESPPCAKYDELMKEVYNFKRVRETEEENQEFYKAVSNYSGYPELNISNIWLLYDTLQIERIHGLEWPSWVTEEIYEKTRALSNYHLTLLTPNSHMARFRVGLLLRQLLHNIDMRVENESKIKFYMYITHDYTITGLLSAMQVKYHNYPPTASTLLMEVYSQTVETEVQWFVQVLYKNDTAADPYPLHLPGCQSAMCSLKEFQLAVEFALPDNFASECSTDKKLSNLVLPIVLVNIFLLVIICGCLFICFGPSADYPPFLRYFRCNYQSVS